MNVSRPNIEMWQGLDQITGCSRLSDGTLHGVGETACRRKRGPMKSMTPG